MSGVRLVPRVGCDFGISKSHVHALANGVVRSVQNLTCVLPACVLHVGRSARRDPGTIHRASTALRNCRILPAVGAHPCRARATWRWGWYRASRAPLPNCASHIQHNAILFSLSDIFDVTIAYASRRLILSADMIGTESRRSVRGGVFSSTDVGRGLQMDGLTTVSRREIDVSPLRVRRRRESETRHERHGHPRGHGGSSND